MSGLLATLTAATSPRAKGATFSRQFDGRPACRIAARIACQGRNPVYPGQPDDDAGDAACQDHGKSRFLAKLGEGRSVMIGETSVDVP